MLPLVTDGPHVTEVLAVLSRSIKSEGARATTLSKAVEILGRSVNPVEVAPSAPSDGLLYGLIQSGKTSIITVTAALAADNGFKCILILTSDIDPLYDQTLARAREALRGLPILGKHDWKDANRFARTLRLGPFVVVCSKNASKLANLLEAFREARAKGLPALLIDDEADQASLNTSTSKGPAAQVSAINQAISEFRSFFPVNTYLQVTATPQALFLQRPDHSYRPSFTVLSAPGPGYVGGDAFFGAESTLLRYVDLAETNQLRSSNAPGSTDRVPAGLRRALTCFLVGAGAQLVEEGGSSYAFLCHVSVNTRDHQNIVRLIDRFKEDSIAAFNQPGSSKHSTLEGELEAAYQDLNGTAPTLPPFAEVVEKIRFHLPGASIQLVNATSNEEIRLSAAFNILVGGNKLGRGVTIPRLLVSYYGRNPRRPNADTVLQHARMYGYRKATVGVTRLFLPEDLAHHFRLIHQMESALRDICAAHPDGKFEGLFISPPLSATRRNVLDPNSLGFYAAGRNYNPTYPLRTEAVRGLTEQLDLRLAQHTALEPIPCEAELIKELLSQCRSDPKYPAELWNLKMLETAIDTVVKIRRPRSYLIVRRGRALTQPRGETDGILSGGEAALAPPDGLTLYLYRQNANPPREVDVWWPQLRFPAGNYVLAFSFDRKT